VTETTPPTGGELHWVVVIPVKGTAAAKSRLGGDPQRRNEIARAIALDTVTAALRTPAVAHVVVVTSADAAAWFAHLAVQVVEERRPSPATAAGDAPGDPLNSALRQALATVGADPRWKLLGTAILLGDVPGVRPSELAGALALAAGHPLAMVPDVDNTGTVLTTTLPGSIHHPRFGPDSARAHRAAGYRPLDIPAGSGLRQDVDTPEQLEDLERHGIGAHTLRSIGRPGDRVPPGP